MGWSERERGDGVLDKRRGIEIKSNPVIDVGMKRDRKREDGQRKREKK